MKTSALLLSIGALLHLSAYEVAVAQDQAEQEEATGEVSQATIGGPKIIVLENVPRATAQAQAIATPNLRPATGLSDEQQQAVEKEAATLPDPNGEVTSGEVPLPSSSPERPEGAFTPQAFSGFVAQDQDLTCTSGLAPSDMGLAVGQNHVVQVVNDCIAVYDKTTGALLPSYPRSLNTFLGFPANNVPVRFLGDPRAMYDFVAGS